MADLLRDVTSDGAGTGVSITGPCTLFVENNSVFDGARIHIEMATNNTAAEYASIGHDFQNAGAVAFDGQGTYFLRAVVKGAGSSTSVSCEANQ